MQENHHHADPAKYTFRISTGTLHGIAVGTRNSAIAEGHKKNRAVQSGTNWSQLETARSHPVSSNNAGKRLSSAAAADLIVCHCHPHHRPPPSSPSVVHHINVYANFERKIAKKATRPYVNFHVK